MQKENKINFAYLFPAVFCAIQVVPPIVSILLLSIFALLAVIRKSLRRVCILFCISITGYLIWEMVSPKLAELSANPFTAKILGRFGLLGYIVLFIVWNMADRSRNSLMRVGYADKIIHMPFVWKGKQEPIWRFLLIFCGICLVPMLISISQEKPTLKLILFGFLFSDINSMLEEIIWRGFILERLLSDLGETAALITGSLTFGIYHISLGFPLWACIIFAIGGFYMGGTVIKSKGLTAAIVMHFFINIIFVFYGLIF